MSYTFLPWLLEGAAADLAGDGQASLRLLVNDTPVDPLKLRLLGPGDVLGFDQRLVVRTDPPHLARGVEPNYFPFVELDRPSFPWLFTPAAPDGRNRLRPWICLVVVRQQDGVTFAADPVTKAPVLTIEPPAVPAAELPDLAESWAWAHVQVTGPASGAELARVLAEEPHRSVARLVCPRRLRPASGYHACLVPAFAAGVAAGLGRPPGDDQADAWKPGDQRAVLPVYHHWEFATGDTGDFETLARALRGRRPPARVGRRRLDLTDAGFPLPAGAAAELEGALRVPGPTPDPGPDQFATHLAGLLGRADPRTVGPPLYGGVQAGVATLPDAGWLRQLNLEPRHRAAAGLGARIVREQQERLMEAAWAQAGAIQETNQVLARSQLARGVGRSVWQRRLAPLADQAPETLLRIAAPARLPSGTLRRRVVASPLPDVTLDPAFRRLTRPRGPLGRRLGAATGTPAHAALGLDPHELLADLDPGAAQRRRAASQVSAPAVMGVMDRPDPLAPILHGPEFPAPMAADLQRLSVDYLLPGTEHIPPDTVLALEPNRPFVAAFLAGLNHEMQRELLWREYPVEAAVTCFRVFWDRRGLVPADAPLDDLADVPPIDRWDPAEDLGQRVRADPSGELVLVVRSELLRRFPNAIVFAAKAAAGAPRRTLADQTDPANRRLPRFAGFIDPDISFFGFGLGEAQARGDDDGLGWYFVFQEQPSEPRFGLDEDRAGWLDDPPTRPVPGTNEQKPALDTAELAWGHLVDQQRFATLAHAPVESARPAGWWFPDRPELSWTGGSGDLAALTLQRPARVALHAELLLPPRPAP